MKRFYVESRGWPAERYFYRTTGTPRMMLAEGVGHRHGDDKEPHVWGVPDEEGLDGGGSWFPVRTIHYVETRAPSRDRDQRRKRVKTRRARRSR